MENFSDWLNEAESLRKRRKSWTSQVYDMDIPYKEPNNKFLDRLNDEIEEAKRLAGQNGLPLPVKRITTGSVAHIFSTTDPNVILRISSDDIRNLCERVIELPQFQKTGGVNVILKLIRNKGTLFTWKERVETDWPTKLMGAYIDDKEKWRALDQIKFLYTYKDEKSMRKLLEVLKTIPETKNLVKAIIKGIPINDLYTDNLGLSLPGSKYPNSLQVIDC